MIATAGYINDMERGFPEYTHSAKLGDLGVSIVSRVVEEFGWLFKQNHQEHDFGIDGQIEAVTKDGAVTGQMLACQIKCGASFFRESNPWGYVYRGETKHFNYLANYPMPVIIVICNPDSREAYWAHFKPKHAQVSNRGWKLTVPYDNKLKASQEDFLALLPPAVDHLTLLKDYWDRNNLLLGFSNIIFLVNRQEVELTDLSRVTNFIQRLRATKEMACHCKGKLELGFSGYDADPRELFEINEVKRYVVALDKAFPELFFFCRTEEPASTIPLFLFCLVGVGWARERATVGSPQPYLIERGDKLGDFLNRHFSGLNSICEWLAIPQAENDRVTRAIGKILGVPGSAKRKRRARQFGQPA